MNIRIEQDEENTNLYIDIDGKKVAELSMQEESIDFFIEEEIDFFQTLIPEEKRKEIEKKTEDLQNITKISHIEVDMDYMQQGYGSLLLDKAMEIIDKNDSQAYLNACSVLSSPISLSKLEDFYRKRGFEQYLAQGENTMMIRHEGVKPPPPKIKKAKRPKGKVAP